jgi:acylphosphatase
VQGVFYRQSTREKAMALGIKGFVRNESNGDVYIEAEGEESLLKEFIEWCKIGPAKAKVTEVKAEEGYLKNLKDFIIKR